MRRVNLKDVLTFLHSERPKLYTILAFLSATGLKKGGQVWLKAFYLTNASLLQCVLYLPRKLYKVDYRAVKVFGIFVLFSNYLDFLPEFFLSENMIYKFLINYNVVPQHTV